jgi:hypothetical protein
MPEARQEDLSMMFEESIVLYRDKPVYVTAVRGTNFHFYHPEDGDLVRKYSDELWTSPTRRIGMVNLDGTVVYVARRPVRKYSVGFNSNNLVVHELEGAAKTLNHKVALQTILGLRHPGLYASLSNVYPTFPEACIQAAKVKGCVAFDKQFAVDANGTIFYKSKQVGGVAKGAKDESEIDFLSGFSYLNLLLQNGYRNIGSFSP